MRLFHKYLIGTFISITVSVIFSLLAILIPLNTFVSNNKDTLVNEKKQTISAFFHENSHSLMDKAVEYSYWNDLIEALERKDALWIEENITQYLYSSPFNVDLAYLKSDFYPYESFYSDALTMDQIKELEVQSSKSQVLLPLHTYKAIDHQLYSFVIAPITNNDGTTPSVGFLILGRKIDREILLSLKNYIGSNTSLNLEFQKIKPIPQNDQDQDSFIFFPHSFRDFSGQSVASLAIRIDDFNLHHLHYILFKNIFSVILVSAGLSFIFIYSYTTKVSKQVEKVVEGIKIIGDGDYSSVLVKSNIHEIQIITDSINKLSSNILKRIEQDQENYFKTIETLIAAIELKDPYTKGHSERVSDYSIAIASSLTIDNIEKIKVAALMHDIGKIGIPEYILNKPGPLNTKEFHHIEEHPEKGFKILNIIESFDEVKYMIRYHHEWYNGEGYPHKLAGEQIPLGARIIAVADAFDAMTSDRSYRKALSMEDAFNEIKQKSGTQFDPHVVAGFIKARSAIYKIYHSQTDSTT